MQSFLTSLVRSRTFLLYFTLGILAYLAYWLTNGLPLIFLLIGPPLFVVAMIRGLIPPTLPLPPWVFNPLLLILVTLLYFSLIGVHQHYLRHERSWLRRLSVLITMIFLVGIHYLAWNNLSAYYIPHR